MADYSRFKFIQVETQDRIATVTLNRPERLNAVHGEFHEELEHLWADIAEDPGVYAIVLTGAGRAFCSGGDVKAMATGTWAGAKGNLSTPSHARRIVQNMLDVEQPLIAAVNGDAMGLGATLALFCDITVMAETARIADTHVRAGLVAGDGGAVMWPLLVGVSRAKEFLMRANMITGAEAAKMGLVNYAVPAEQVMVKARELALELANGPAWAIRWTKMSVNKWLKHQVNLILDSSLAFETLSFTTEDHREAASAFVEKRAPKFKGL